MKPHLWLTAPALALSFACGTEGNEPAATSPAAVPGEQLFNLLPPSHTGISFSNVLSGEEKLPVFNYINFYNGGGVAIGDINNDGLQDVYFTGNMVPCRLYLNKGGLKFEDVTASAGVDGAGGWCTGVTMGDVNGDGWLDIYVCRSFNLNNPALRENLLYVNNGDATFTEKGSSYGVNCSNFSTQAAFLDYDVDGDLDLFVGNHPRKHRDTNRFRNQLFPNREESDILYRNNGDGTFTDVTEEAGLLNWGFLLAVVCADLDKDGYPDIYVANDHAEPDKVYHNNGDGTFTNIADQALKHMSNFSMGADVADFNNDALPDIFVLDMMAADNYRQKTNMSAMAPDQFWEYVRRGYHYQYMRNVLQLNNGNGTFSDVGFLAGITNTDWSWAGLFADFDNDGNKDIFVSNGYKLGYRNNDFVNTARRMSDSVSARNDTIADEVLYAMIPQTKLKNYLFRNNGDFTFTDVSDDFGLTHLSFSNGTSCGDLDNDGDLDLVISNIADTAFVYENTLKGGSYLQVKLEGPPGNPYGLGAKLELRTSAGIQYQEQTLTRGFQSSVPPVIHFGLGGAAPEEMEVTWPDGKVENITGLSSGSIIRMPYSNAGVKEQEKRTEEPLFAAWENSGAVFVHRENEYDDYRKEVLLPHKMSQFGPSVSTGDLNGDGLEDFYAGGAAGQPGEVYFQTVEGNFSKAPYNNDFFVDRFCEDLGSVIFDADGDGDSDLYVVSGGNEFEENSTYLHDRLYLNDGKGKLESSYSLAGDAVSGSCAAASDFDSDGDMDLFVGGRVVPGKYPLAPRSSLLVNNGGVFKDATPEIAPGLVSPGMVTSAVWTDVNGDGSAELIIAGEWMPLKCFSFIQGVLKDISAEVFEANLEGWWMSLAAKDIDADGDDDLAGGNLGLNYKYKASAEEPFLCYSSDFDRNGRLDIVLGYYNGGACFPVRGRQCSSQQMPSIKKKFPTYDEFGSATLGEVYGPELEKSLHLEAKLFSSCWFENKGGKFTARALPVEAQFAPVFGILIHDFDGDKLEDLLIAGNLYQSEVETGRADAGTGLMMKGDGKGGFTPLTIAQSGFFADGDVRDMDLIGTREGLLVIVANNSGPVQVFRVVKRGI